MLKQYQVLFFLPSKGLKTGLKVPTQVVNPSKKFQVVGKFAIN